MPRDISPTGRTLLRGSVIEVAMLLDLFVDGTSQHCWSANIPLSYDVGDGVTRAYEAMAGRFSWGEDAISMGSDLNPEALTMTFDASRVLEDADFVGRFADSQWHRRRARLSAVVFAVNSGWATPVTTLATWEGEMDYREFPELQGAPPTMMLTIESGTFRYLGRNLQTRTDENQQRFFPGDTFFQDLPGLIGRQLPWHRSWVGIYATGGSIDFTNYDDRSPV